MLVHAFYPIFKLAAVLGQLLCDLVRAAGNIATNCGGELYELTDPKFVAWYGGSIPALHRDPLTLLVRTLVLISLIQARQ